MRKFYKQYRCTYINFFRQKKKNEKRHSLHMPGWHVLDLTTSAPGHRSVCPRSHGRVDPVVLPSQADGKGTDRTRPVPVLMDKNMPPRELLLRRQVETQILERSECKPNIPNAQTHRLSQAASWDWPSGALPEGSVQTIRRIIARCQLRLL